MNWLPQALTTKAAREIERDPGTQAVAEESERKVQARPEYLYKDCQQRTETSKRGFPKPVFAARQMDAHYLNTGRQMTLPTGKD